MTAVGQRRDSARTGVWIRSGEQDEQGTGIEGRRRRCRDRAFAASHAPWTIHNALREDASSLPAGSRQRTALGGTAPRLSSTGALQQLWDPERLSVEIRT